MKLNLGCGRTYLDGWTNVDLPESGHKMDVAFDLDFAHPRDWAQQFGEDVEHSQMIHVIEHLRNPLLAMEGLWRVTKPGGTVEIHTPHGACDDAWEDPTHVRPMFPGSFLFFGQPTYWRANYGYRGDWKIDELVLVVDQDAVNESMSDDEINAIITTRRNAVIEMRCLLSAVKPTRPNGRELMDKIRPVAVLGERT